MLIIFVQLPEVRQGQPAAASVPAQLLDEAAEAASTAAEERGPVHRVDGDDAVRRRQLPHQDLQSSCRQRCASQPLW